MAPFFGASFLRHCSLFECHLCFHADVRNFNDVTNLNQPPRIKKKKKGGTSGASDQSTWTYCRGVGGKDCKCMARAAWGQQGGLCDGLLEYRSRFGAVRLFRSLDLCIDSRPPLIMSLFFLPDSKVSCVHPSH